jgi:hypothetical protein
MSVELIKGFVTFVSEAESIKDELDRVVKNTKKMLYIVDPYPSIKKEIVQKIKGLNDSIYIWYRRIYTSSPI